MRFVRHRQTVIYNTTGCNSYLRHGLDPSVVVGGRLLISGRSGHFCRQTGERYSPPPAWSLLCLSCFRTRVLRTWRRKCLCVAAVLHGRAWLMSPERLRVCGRAADIGVAEAFRPVAGAAGQVGPRRESRTSATWSRFAFSTNRWRSEPWLHATNSGQPTTNWMWPKPPEQWTWEVAECCPRPLLRPFRNHCGYGRACKTCPTGGKLHVPAASTALQRSVWPCWTQYDVFVSSHLEYQCDPPHSARR